VGPGQTHYFSINCDEGQQMVVTIKTQLDDPKAYFGASVQVEGVISRKHTTLASGSGPDIKLQWTSPGFGSLPILLSNHGPGNARCKITHNGAD
jgi:hypothetical protein